MELRLRAVSCGEHQELLLHCLSDSNRCGGSAQLTPDVPVYNECVMIHLPGPLNVSVLEQSFTEFVRRHEAWRTSFPEVNGLPVQNVPLGANVPVSAGRFALSPEGGARGGGATPSNRGCPFAL